MAATAVLAKRSHGYARWVAQAGDARRFAEE
jgi:hypothetical protein